MEEKRVLFGLSIVLLPAGVPQKTTTLSYTGLHLTVKRSQMRLSLFRRLHPSAAQRRVVDVHSSKPIGTSAISEKWTPLCERPAQYVLEVSSFKEWKWRHTNALKDAAAVSGVSISELKTEMHWLMEDAIAATREKSDADWVSLTSGLHQLDLAESQTECLMRLSLNEIDALWSRRLNDRMPIQYLTHTVHWRDFILCIGPGVLIPRPETEQMIDLAEAIMQQNPDLCRAPWADLGTGSGAIAIGLGKLLQKYGDDVEVLAVDRSPVCIDCTRHNLKRLNVTNVTALLGNWFEPLEPWKDGLAGIVSNPPYIPSEDIPALQPEVSRHEPHGALDGGLDGLTDIHILIDNTSDYLISGGVLVLETNGPSQTMVVKEWLKSVVSKSSDPVFDCIQVNTDIFGVERFVTATKY